jgi:cytochrome c oxidase assembly protein subunit 15
MVHLNFEVAIYSVLLWNALTLLRKPQEMLMSPANLAGTNRARGLAILLLYCVAFNIISGAVVAGIDAGKVFNTWPLYNGNLVPGNMFSKVPSWKNWFENLGLVQFNHRNLGYLTATATLYAWTQSKKLNLLKGT